MILATHPCVSMISMESVFVFRALVLEDATIDQCWRSQALLWIYKLSAPGVSSLYKPHAMQCFVPHEIEPFYSEPAEFFDANGDWHWTGSCKIAALRVADEFFHWRRFHMNRHTERKDAEKRMESMRRSEHLIAALDERRKKNKSKQKNHAQKHIKFRIRTSKRQRKKEDVTRFPGCRSDEDLAEKLRLID